MSFVIFCTLLLALSALLFALLRRFYSYWARRRVPHDGFSIMLTNMRGLGKTMHLRDIVVQMYRRYKGTTPFAGMYFFFMRSALILDLDLVKNILIKEFQSFHDRGIFNNVRDDPLTGHLFTLEGEPWRAMRHKLTPVFTSGKMRYMFDTVVAVGEQLVTACGVMAQQNAEGVIELKELCARYTTDVIGTCAFGIECNSLHDPEAEFRRRGRSVLAEPRHGRLVMPFLVTNPDLARKMRLKMLSDEVSDFFLGAVRRTVDYRVANGVKRNDFMDLLIAMKAQDEEAARRGNGIDLSHGLTIEQMAAQAFVFFVAGFDTSSTTMSFCIYELAMQPVIQEHLRNEILSVLKAHKDALTYETMKEMKLLDQVLSETLRKYPVLPHLMRKAMSDYRVPNTDFVIEKGVSINIPVIAIHHDPEIYPAPERFDPARFEPDAIKQRHPCAYLPFGDGPRNCIGMRFGKMQAKIGLIALLQHYKFRAAARTENPIELDLQIILTTPKNGIYLRVEPLH